MKNNQKILSFIIALILCCMFPLYKGEASTDKIEQCKNEIIDFNLIQNNVSTKEEWIKNIIPKDIGISSEWYVISLSQTEETDFSEYEKALLSYLEKKKITSESSKLKFAFALASIGSCDDYIQSTVNSSIGKQGLMSFVYGLHFLNNGYTHEVYTKNALIDEILSMQNQDGGWCVIGKNSDVDVTAMTVQALASEYLLSNQKVVSAVDKALSFLSDSQLPDGDYKSFGVSNPESGSQVIIALSSLNIDFNNDSRFIKDGKNLFDGIMKYSLSDGSFSHSLGGESNSNSTVQVFCACVSYDRMKSNKEGFYILDSLKPKDEPSLENSEIANVSKPSDSSVISETVQSEEKPSDEEEQQTENSESKTNYKLYIIIVIISLWIVLCVVLFVSKRMNIKNFIFITALALLLILTVLLLKIQSREEYYNSSDISKENVIGTVSISINCKSILDESHNSYIPSDGIILESTELQIEEGDTVYNILVEASKKYSIQLENNGSEKLAYISGINYLYEFDHGDLSGWMYTVNGKEASVGCSSYELKDGDVIEWSYTTNMFEKENKE